MAATVEAGMAGYTWRETRTSPELPASGATDAVAVTVAIALNDRSMKVVMTGTAHWKL